MRALVLYPMNALVNDQLGRLRLLLGDDRVTSQFDAWANRPARFARYTSRTLYPGVRTAKKDQEQAQVAGEVLHRAARRGGEGRLASAEARVPTPDRN